MNVAPTVSVIVPIYNVEDYLEECLDSIIGQTLESLEIICINDGSTDGSLDILRRYEQKDSRIIVIDKENGGYGKGVNCGLERATGEWVAIVEPDDLIDARMYEDLVNESRLEDGGIADIVKSGYWLYFDLDDGLDPYVERPPLNNCMRCYRYEFDVTEDAEVLRHHPSIWSAIYRREFIEKYGIRMIEPKGAGWADNPWFFRTMLLAKRIVWVPAAYYRYRQTNPNASSTLKDFHMPFDRLRDIHAIYEEMGIDSSELLTVFYQRCFNYICNSMLDEFHFQETDPDMRALTHEVFGWMNEEILFQKKNGITALHKDYYRDVMGQKLAKVKSHEREGKPFFSVVIAMHDDRKGLWRTIDSLLKQKRASFEVIAVDCASPDRSAEIVKAIAEKDRRFCLLEEPSGNVGRGFNCGLEQANGQYVMFMRPGVVLMEVGYLEKCQSALELPEAEGADIIGTSLNLQRFRQSRFDESPMTEVLDCKDNPAIVAANLEPYVYDKAFRRTTLKQRGVQFSETCDDDGYAFNVAAMTNVSKAVLVDNLEVRIKLREKIERNFLENEQDVIVLELGRISEMAAVAERDGSNATWRVARACIVHAMTGAVAKKGLFFCGRALWEALRDVFVNKYGLMNQSGSYYPNSYDYSLLAETFCSSYERHCMVDEKARFFAEEWLGNREDSLQRKNSKLEKRVVKANDQIARIRQSKSYKLGHLASKAYKAAIPKRR